MSDRQLIADLLSALEYHTEQTRPIEFSRVAIEAAREYLRKPAQQQEPVATVISRDKHALGEQTIAVDTPLEIGTVLYTFPPAQQKQEPVAYPTNGELEDLWFGSHAGHPADFAAEVLERWGGAPSGLMGYGGSLNKPAAPQPAQQQEPVLCINPKVIDPATGKVRNGTGALTYSDEPCAGWSMPLYEHPPAQRKPLTREQLEVIVGEKMKSRVPSQAFRQGFRAAEAAHGITGETK